MTRLPPQLRSTAGTGNADTNATSASYSVTVGAGDSVVVVIVTSDAPQKVTAGPSGGGIPFTLRESRADFTGYGNAYVWAGTAPSSGTFSISASASGGSAGANYWNMRIWSFYDSEGFGTALAARNTGTNDGGGTFNLVGTRSAVVWGMVDWNATAAQGTPYSAAGSHVMDTYFKGGAAVYWMGRYPDNPGPGTKDIGVTGVNPKWSQAGIEVLGVDRDITAPSQVTGVSATALSESQIRVNWTAATDDYGVASYTIRRGGTVVATGVTGTTWTDTGRSPATSYSYTVQAIDGAGNAGAQSASASATTFNLNIVNPTPLVITGDGTLALPNGTPAVTSTSPPTLSGDGTLVIPATGTPAVTGSGLTLAADGTLGFSVGIFGATGSLTLTGDGTVGLTLVTFDVQQVIPLSGGSTLGLAVQTITVDQAATTLTGGSGLDLQATWIVVPASGSITMPPLTGDSALELDGHPHLVEPNPLVSSGDGKLTWVPVHIAGGGELKIASTGLLKIKDPWTLPVNVWTELEVWREADVWVWNGRSWLSVPLKKFHIY